MTMIGKVKTCGRAVKTGLVRNTTAKASVMARIGFSQALRNHPIRKTVREIEAMISVTTPFQPPAR